jgi:hypothetical protein
MHGPANPSHELQVEIERKLLAALCQSTVNPDTRATILRRLKTHRFAEPDYEVIYRALVATPSAGRAETMQALTQAVTRMGFPDMDLGELFKESSLTSDEVASLLDCL